MESLTRRELQTPGTEETIPYSQHVVVATHFLYRNYIVSENPRSATDTDGIRGDLALEMIARATQRGIRVVASDAGSSDGFLESLEQYRAKGLTVIQTEIARRGPQRRQAFEKAKTEDQAEVVVYTQPEKTSLIDHLEAIVQPILTDQADIVIPMRNPDLFARYYPDYMRTSEMHVNKTYNWLLQRADFMRVDQEFDWFFGPIAFKNDQEIVDLFMKKYAVVSAVRSNAGAAVDPELHSAGHYFPVIEALAAGKRVISVEIPFIYPEKQKENELTDPTFRQRRLMDAAAYRLETMHLIAELRNDSRSKIREVSD